MAFPSFSSGDILTASDMNAVGLWLIKTQSLTTVSNAITSVFSSTYDAYRVVVSDMNNATATNRQVTLRFRTTSDDTGANYFWGQYGFYSATPFSSGAAGATYGDIMAIADTTNDGGSLILDIVNPNLAKATTYSGSAVAYQSNVTAYTMRFVFGGVNTNTQYTGFSINGTTDNLSGTVRVYGYRN